MGPSAHGLATFPIIALTINIFIFNTYKYKVTFAGCLKSCIKQTVKI